MAQEGSVFVGGAPAHEVHDVPMAVIARPLPSELDEQKVRVRMSSHAICVRIHHTCRHFTLGLVCAVCVCRCAPSCGTYNTAQT